MTRSEDLAALEREAIRQGASDGRYGAPACPGDFKGAAKSAYLRAYQRARDAEKHKTGSINMDGTA